MIKIDSRVKIINSIAFTDAEGTVVGFNHSLRSPVLVKVDGYNSFYFDANELEEIK